MKLKHIIFLLFIFFVKINLIFSQNEISEGPFSQLIIRGGTLINGNGSPPIGPVDIVIEKNIITKIVTIGYPGVKINQNKRPTLIRGGKELNASGMFVLPGFIDMHAHI